MFVHENKAICLHRMHVAIFLAFSLVVEVLHATPQRRNLASESLKLPPGITDSISDSMGISSSLSNARQFVIANDINPMASYVKIKQTLTNPATAGKPSTAAFPNNAENRSISGNSKKNMNQKTSQTQTANVNDNVVFPSSSTLSGVKVRINTPLGTDIPKTKLMPNQSVIDKCRTNGIGGSLCNVTDNYPANLVKSIINSKTLSVELFGSDSLSSDIIHTRFDEDDGYKGFCDSVEQVIFPKMGETANKEWKFIFQDPDDPHYRQGVRTETCVTNKENNKSCNLIEVVPNGYDVRCTQKYIYRTMVSIGSDAQVQPDLFKLPSCCVCVYKSSTSDLRMAPLQQPNRSSTSKRG